MRQFFLTPLIGQMAEVRIHASSLVRPHLTSLPVVVARDSRYHLVQFQLDSILVNFVRGGSNPPLFI